MTSRLHPLSIPYRAAETVVRIAWLLVLVSLGSASVDQGFRLAVGIVIGGLALALAYQVAFYRRFTYGLTADVLEIRSGIVSRRHREIPYARVQNVDLSRNAVQRILGITAVAVETAGGGETEANLRYVSETEANRLQEELGRRSHGETADESRDATTLFALTPRELALLGLVSLDLRFVSVIFILLTISAPSVADQLQPTIGGTLLIAAPAVLVGIYLVAAVLSGAVSVGNYFGFHLERIGDELRYERGLVQRFAGTIPLSKIQTLSITANVLARWLGYGTLVVETAGYAPGDADKATVVPIARRERAVGLARSIESFGDVEFDRPPKRTRTRYTVRYTLVLVVVLAVAYGIDQLIDVPVAWYIVLAGVPLIPIAAHLKWRHRGYATLSDHFVTRNGFWTETVTIVPYYRIQNVLTTATIFQRRRQLATLTIDTAGSRSLTGSQPAAVDIDAGVASHLREEVADSLQQSLRARRVGTGWRPPPSTDKPAGEDLDGATSG